MRYMDCVEVIVEKNRYASKDTNTINPSANWYPYSQWSSWMPSKFIP